MTYSSSLFTPSSSTLDSGLALTNHPSTTAKRPRSFWDTVLTDETPPSHHIPKSAPHQTQNSSLSSSPASTLITSPISDFRGVHSPSPPPSAVTRTNLYPSHHKTLSTITPTTPVVYPQHTSDRSKLLPPTRTISKEKKASPSPVKLNYLTHPPSEPFPKDSCSSSITSNVVNTMMCDGQQSNAMLDASQQQLNDFDDSRTEENEGKPHVCETCGSTFARSSHLRLHIRTIHYKMKPFQCGECGASFGHVSSKYRHYRTVHLKRRDFACDRCGQTFAERSAVLKHCRTVHEGSRPYPCPTCGFRFHFKLHLAQHIATVHDKLRPHQCPVCNARFGQRSSLNRHARQIHGDCRTGQGTRSKRDKVNRITKPVHSGKDMSGQNPTLASLVRSESGANGNHILFNQPPSQLPPPSNENEMATRHIAIPALAEPWRS